MRQHHVVFGVDGNVHFQRSDAEIQSKLKCRDRIFRQQTARTTMTLQVDGPICNIS